MTKIIMKITYLKFHSYIPGANELKLLHLGLNKISQPLSNTFSWKEQILEVRHVIDFVYCEPCLQTQGLTYAITQWCRASKITSQATGFEQSFLLYSI